MEDFLRYCNSKALDIFRPVETDFDELTGVWEASVRATHHFLSEADILYFRPLVRNEYLPQADLYAVRGDGYEIIAFMGVDGPKIEMLFVSPVERGKGFGRKLAEYAIYKLGVCTVDVNEQNGQASGFYERLGFEIVSRDEKDSSGKPFPILHLKLKDAEY